MGYQALEGLIIGTRGEWIPSPPIRLMESIKKVEIITVTGGQGGWKLWNLPPSGLGPIIPKLRRSEGG